MTPAERGPADLDQVSRCNISAERAVLGGMMLSSDAVADVLDTMAPTEHYLPAHQVIHAVILDLYGRGDPFDPIAVAAELTTRGELQRVGGAPYLHTLMASVPTAANAGYYARLVHEQFLFRRIIEHATRALQIGSGTSADLTGQEAVTRVQEDAFALTEGEQRRDYRPLVTVLLDSANEVELISRHDGQLLGVPTGFNDLDALLLGLRAGQMVTLAARPGVGKSCLALDFCRAASIEHGMTSLFFSLEMSYAEIGMRLLSAEARVPLYLLRSGQLTDEEWRRVGATIARVSDAPLYIDDTPNLTLAEIRAKARRLQREHDLRLLVVDYLQLMDNSPGAARRDRRESVDAISRGLKLLAKQLQIPVLAVAQLNRGPELRQDKVPMLADLRESGQIEQDSDIVILIHREDTHNRESPRAGEADLIVAKHRNGPTATVTVAFQGHYSRFVDMSPG